MWDIFIRVPRGGPKPRLSKGRKKRNSPGNFVTLNEEYAILHDGDNQIEYDNPQFFFDAGYQYDGYQRVNGRLYHHFSIREPP